jgi:thiol:disulfide interchange protein DsbD
MYKNIISKGILLSIFTFLALAGYAQILEPAKWEHEVSKKDVEIGEEVELIFVATIDKDWYLYSSDFDPDLGPTVTEFTFKPNDSYELVGGIRPQNPKKKYDDLWEGEYTYFKERGEFRQTVKILKENPVIEGSYNYQVCTDLTGRCIPFDEDFTFDEFSVSKPQVAVKEDPIEKEPVEEDATALVEEVNTDDSVLTEVADTAIAVEEEDTILSEELATIDEMAEAEEIDIDYHKEAKEDLLLFFFLAFGSGLIALLTPCVFPMIPMTVSFFSHSAKSKGQSFSMSIFFGISIIAIYILLGFITSLIFGPEIANFLSTHWIPNVLFFLIFIIFAISFFGAFEITLPSSFVNKIDKQADKGGYIGVFFMAFTLALVSFSCTGPIVGSILVASAAGQVMMPLIGMAGFSTAFAIPFTLFAAFPSWLKGLPSSGGWLNSVKVVLGFLEVAFAFKFLSIADQTYHWGILDRDVFLAIWIVTFTFLGLYLLGKIKLPHDSEGQKIGVGRMLLALTTFAFVIYLIPGMFGAPLKAMSGYLPPQNSHDFDLAEIIRVNGGGGSIAAEDAGNLCDKPKYADLLHLPHGLVGYFDLKQAMECSKQTGKPIFVDFTGHGCVNCREMEANVWSDPRVLKKLRQDYVIAALYVDDKTELPEEEWYRSEYDNKMKKTIGKQNADLQIVRFNNNAQPYYCLLDGNGELLVTPKAYDLKIENFIDFLDKGVEAYNNRE